MKTEIELNNKCQGDCLNTHDHHRGIVQKVEVSGIGLWPPLKFYYCENAIEEDICRGFEVTKLDKK